MTDLAPCPEMPNFVWVYTEKGSNFLHACYLPFSGNDFGRLTEPVKYTRANTPTPDLGLAVAALRNIEALIFKDMEPNSTVVAIVGHVKAALKSLGVE